KLVMNKNVPRTAALHFTRFLRNLEMHFPYRGNAHRATQETLMRQERAFRGFPRMGVEEHTLSAAETQFLCAARCASRAGVLALEIGRGFEVAAALFPHNVPAACLTAKDWPLPGRRAHRRSRPVPPLWLTG